MAMSYKHRIQQIICNYMLNPSPPSNEKPTPPLPLPKKCKNPLAKSIQSNKRPPTKTTTPLDPCIRAVGTAAPPALRMPHPSVRWSHGVVPRLRKQSLRGWSWVMLLVVGWVICSLRGFLFFGRIFPEVLGGKDCCYFLVGGWDSLGFFRRIFCWGFGWDLLLMSSLLCFFCWGDSL